GYQQAYLDLIRGVAATARQWPEVPLVDHSLYGELPRTNVSVKLSALDNHFDPIDHDGAIQRAGERLRELLRAARERGAFINIAMESYAPKNLAHAVFREVLEDDEFRDFTDIGIVVQAYLKDSADDVQSLLDWTR